jgi:hypothetical protein
MITFFRYIPYSQLLLALCMGWKPVADLGHSHGSYAVLCQWTGEDEPS